MKKLSCSVLLIGIYSLSAIHVHAQQIPSGFSDKYYNLIAPDFNDSNAYRTVAFTENHWRLAGNKGFNETIFYVENILKQSGFVKEINGEATAPLTYRIEQRKMDHPAWEPVNATLTIVGESKPLLEFISNRNMLGIHSSSTGPEGVTAEVVYIDSASEAYFSKIDLKGKIVFFDSNINDIYSLSMKHGVIGMLAYGMPSYTQPEKYQNSIQFHDVPSDDILKWTIFLSNAARKKIKIALQNGPVKVHVLVESKSYDADELTLIANMRGAVKPEERFVFSAHVQEPGANDNGTGIGTLAEMARVTANLVNKKLFEPKRTITFLWGDEIVSTRRYIQDDSIRAKGIKWGLSLDMVGEDAEKTSGTFLIEKMPDPSAIWTRGNDKHTEWGGETLKESDLFPNYFTDFLLNRCRDLSKKNGWVVNTNPFEGGSDHTPFIEAGIPGLLMWHFTDVFYHTDADRLDKVSPQEMKNVGVSALIAAFILANADESTCINMIDEIETSALQRLQSEFELGKKAIQQGSAKETEQHILKVWAQWYAGAIDKMDDINVSGRNNMINKAIGSAKENVLKKAKELNDLL